MTHHDAHSHPHRESLPDRRDRPNRAAQFFRKHNRLVTFLGASIVLATFIVKEGIREHFKSLTETIDTAESIFLIRSELVQVRDTLEMPRSVNRADVGTTAPRDIERTWHYLKVGQTHMDVIARLIRKLPNPKIPIAVNGWSISESYNVEDKSMTPFWLTNTWYIGTNSAAGHWHNLENKIKQLWKSEYSVRGLIRPDHSRDAEASRAAHNLSTEAHAVLADIQDFGLLVLKKAAEQNERNEHRYQFFTNISYGLYALGWTLGLAGRIFSVPGLGFGEGED